MSILNKLLGKSNKLKVDEKKVYKNPTVIYDGREIELKDKDVENLRQYKANIEYANAGDVKAQFLAGKALYNYAKYNKFAVEQGKEAVELLKKAAAGGIVKANVLVGDYYRNQYLGVEDYTTALEWYKKGADLKDPESYWALGRAFDQGEGVTEDHDRAFTFYLKGAELGEPYSMREVGVAYYEGKCTKRDIKKAYSYLKGAYEAGIDSCKCGYYLSLYYFNGEIVERNTEKGVQILEKLCSDDVSILEDEAVELLIYCYENGIGTSINREAADKLRLRIKEQNDLFDSVVAAFNN